MATFVLFLAAGLVVLAIPVKGEGFIGPGARAFMAAAMFAMAFTGLSDFLDHRGVASGLDQVRDYVTLLFPPLVLYSAYSIYVRQRLNDSHRALRQLEQAHGMIESLVDTTPAGMMVLDVIGHITYANDAARHVLDLDEDERTGELTKPGWLVRDMGEDAETDEPVPDFRMLVSETTFRNRQMLVEWPTGWRMPLAMSTAPLFDAEGKLGGVVAAFLERPA